MAVKMEKAYYCPTIQARNCIQSLPKLPQPIKIDFSAIIQGLGELIIVIVFEGDFAHFSLYKKSLASPQGSSKLLDEYRFIEFFDL